MSARLRGWVLFALSFFTLLFGYLTWRLPAVAPEGASSAAPGVGQPLPDLVLVDNEGRALTFGALRGQRVWLAVLGPSDSEVGRARLLELGRRAAGLAQAGLQLLAVTPDSSAVQATLRRELALGFSLLSDPEAHAAATLCRSPSCQILVDADGVVRWIGAGDGSDLVASPEAVLEATRAPAP